MYGETGYPAVAQSNVLPRTSASADRAAAPAARQDGSAPAGREHGPIRRSNRTQLQQHIAARNATESAHVYAPHLMAGVRPQSTGASVAVLGGFNPRIFARRWFSQQGLVAEAEAEAADVQLVGSQFARIDLPWAVVIVTDARLDVSSKEETVQSAQIRDLGVGIMRLLPHTPVQRAGTNHWSHFSVASEDAWHDLGHQLTPKDLWEEVLQNPGMLILSVQGQRTDGRSGSVRVNVTVQPSGLIRPGIFISVNDDFVIEPDLPEPAGRTAQLLADTWPAGEAQADRIMTAVMRRVRD